MTRSSACRIVITSRCAQTIFVQRRALALAAQKSGWIVTLAGEAQGSRDPFPARLRADGVGFADVPVRQKSLNPLSLARLFFAYLRLFRRSRPDVVHAYTIKPVIAGLLAATAARIPVRIASVAGLGHVFLSDSHVKRTLALALMRWALAQAHEVNFYNAADRDLYLELGLVHPGQARLTPGGSGVDLDHFAAPAMPESKTLVAVFVGRLLREKGIVELLEAAHLIRMAGGNIRIEIVGDIDPNNPSSIDQPTIEAAAEAGEVVWHGATDDVRPMIAGSHVVILPSYREGIPMSLLEAAAMGRAILTTDVPGCIDVVRPGQTGVVVPARDADALAQALLALAADRERVLAMGAAAHLDAAQRFDVRAVTRDLLGQYARLMPNNHQAAASA